MKTCSDSLFLLLHVDNITETKSLCVYESRVQLFATLMDYSPPGVSVHGIFQAQILEWITIYSSRVSSLPRDQMHISCVSCIDMQILYHNATWEYI